MRGTCENATPPSRLRNDTDILAAAVALVALLCAPPSRAADDRYAGVELIPVGFTQTWIVAGEFNGDDADDFFYLPVSQTAPALDLSDGEADGEPRFRRVTVPGTYESASHAEAGLLDDDPHMDLVVSHRRGASILFGDGNGALVEGPTLPALLFCRMARIARIDPDPHADLVIADDQGGILRVYRGDGARGFSHAGDFALQSEPHAFDLADLDGDGRLDAIFTVGIDDLVGVVRGTETALFGAPQFYELGRNNRFAASGDLNGDGAIDIAVTSRNSSTVAVFAGDGRGRLLEPPLQLATAPQPESLAIADLGVDGLLDIVVAGGGDEQHLALHEGRGDGTFLPAAILPVARGQGRLPVSLAIGDRDRDGRPDVIVASLGTPYASLVAGLPGGRLRGPILISVDGEPIRLAAGDLDGDGDLDLVAVLRNVGGLLVLLGDGKGGFALPEMIEASVVPTDVLVADLTSDGIADVAATDLLAGVTLWPGRGDGTFDPPGTRAAGALPEAIAAGDVDGDGATDLAVANRGSNDVSIFLAARDGVSDAPLTVPVGTGPVDLVAGDWSRDGISDLAVVCRQSAEVWTILGGRDRLDLGDPVACSGAPTAAAAGDVDGDGVPDLAVADRGVEAEGSRVLVLFGRGDGSFGEPVEIDRGCEPRAVAVTDPEEGGKGSVAAVCWETGALLLFGDDGTRTFPRRRAYHAGSGPEAILAADLTGDGREDLAVTSRTGAVVVLARGEPPAPAGTFRRGHTNDDGRLDISDPIALLGHLFLGGEIAPCPDAADANDDGRVDLSDAIHALGHLFLGGPPPPAPGPDSCGPDPTEDDLGPCEVPCR